MKISEKIYSNAGPGWLLTAAGLVLAPLLAANFIITYQLSDIEKGIEVIERAGGRSAGYAEELRSIRDTKAVTAKNMKNSLTDMAKAKKNIYETGLSLQEEKRLLEKQLEIMTTYLEVDVQTGKISLARGDQTLKNFPFSPPLMVLGGEKRAAGQLCRIISRERYAYTARGNAEKTSAGLKWNPPQVGENSGDSALGEFVIFTDGPLVLHAPVAKTALHAAYPHLCAGLTLYSARRLYESVFIGNKLLIKGMAAKKP